MLFNWLAAVPHEIEKEEESTFFLRVFSFVTEQKEQRLAFRALASEEKRRTREGKEDKDTHLARSLVSSTFSVFCLYIQTDAVTDNFLSLLFLSLLSEAAVMD